MTLHRHARDQCRCQGPACVAASEVAALGRCGTLPNRPDWDHERWLVTASSSGRPSAKNGMGVLPAFIAATPRSSGTSTPRQIAGRCAWSR